MCKKTPRLRTVNKSSPPYPLNEFGKEFPYILGREVVYLLASKGKGVLEIWNERVSSVREKYKNLRTVVLVKSDDLSQLAVFEFDTIRYDAELFDFRWNERGNLEGFNKSTKRKS